MDATIGRTHSHGYDYANYPPAPRGGTLPFQAFPTAYMLDIVANGNEDTG